MSTIVEVTLHYGGAMDFSGRVPQYVRERTKIITTTKEHMSYVEVKTVIGEMCLRYKEVERMWYDEQNSTLSDGLHRILTNQDAVDGLYCTSENKWYMTIYFEGKFDHDYGADNEDLYVGRNEEDPHLDSMTDDSVAPEFVHLVDEDNRTTDVEFEEALYHMGIRRTRRRVAYMDYSSGEEVEQLQASIIGLAGEGIQEEEAHHQFGPHEPTNDLGHEDQPEDCSHGSESLSEDASEYRKSEDSNHVRGNISEDEAIEDIYDGAPRYDPDSVAFLRLDLEEFVHDLYKCSRVAKAYSYGVPALVGRQGWPHATGYTVLPPPGRRLLGRPKKARRKELAELKGQQRKNGVGTQLRRTGMIMHCRSCTKPGHNARKCPNKGVNEAAAAPGPNDGAGAAMNEGSVGEPNQGPAVEPNEGYAADVDLEDRNVRPRTNRPIPIRLAGNGLQRRKNLCGTCGILGHNARKCPTKQGVQVVTMNETDRRTVDREVAIAQNGVGITHFDDTGNTYFATGGGHRTRHMGNTNPDVRHEVASTIDLNTNVGTQPPQTQERE
ncbi:hypothetical protein LINPERPRIM_LOCUS851 [Linum perenne]